METLTLHLITGDKTHVRATFYSGLAVRLLGAGLILIGDGHDTLFRKGLVVFGVALSVCGIGILRYLLYSGIRKKAKPMRISRIL